MERKQFLIASLAGVWAMSTLKDLKRYSDALRQSEHVMPALFVGHGNPMNAIEENEFSRGWRKIGSGLPRPQAILCISAHWETNGTFITAMEAPQTIHDFSGFPPELFRVQYPAPGSPELAQRTRETVKKAMVELDQHWGLDHGCWSVVKHLYPNADVPTVQLSLDRNQPARWHYELAHELSSLRRKGVLIIGSGNMVHNLRIIDWNTPDRAYDWAAEMNETLKARINRNDHMALVEYSSLGKAAALAIPTPEHYLPMLYILGLKETDDVVRFFNDRTLLGSISMTSFVVSSGE
jgi:4,5-DOPA dioxygenase extradiol